MNEKCDVYSFGVVVLETTMGRHLGELISLLASLSAQHIMLKDVLDPRLSPHINQTIAQNVVLVVTLALACLHSNPKSCPTIKHVTRNSCSEAATAQAILRNFNVGAVESRNIFGRQE